MLGNILFTYMFALILTLLIEIPIVQTFDSVLKYLFSVCNNFNNNNKNEIKVNNCKQNQSKQNTNNKTANTSTGNTSPSTNIELSMCKAKL